MLLKYFFFDVTSIRIISPLCALNSSLNMLKTFFPMEFPTGGICYPRGSRISAPHRQQGNMSGATAETVIIPQSLHLPKCISSMKTAKSLLYSIAVCEIQNACMSSKGKLWKTATALAGAFLEGRAVPVLTARPKLHWKMLYRYCQRTCLKSSFWKISSCKLLYKSQAIFP